MRTIWRHFKKYRYWLLFCVILGLLTAGGVEYYTKSKTPAAAETTVGTVRRGDIKSTVSSTGTVKAVNSVTVSSRVTGLITEVKVKENDYVKAGQVLLVLDDTAIRAQVAQYEAALENNSSIYERSKKLAAIGGESPQQLETDRTNYLTAKAAYDNNISQLGFYKITSPVDGIVIGTPTPAGQTIVQGISEAQALLMIADMSQMQIKTLVDETDIGKIKAGQQVTFTVDAYQDKTFTGKVTSISRSATTSSNVVYYPVYAAVDSPEDLLFPTMTARVTIVTGERKNVLTVPLAAINEEDGRKYVQTMKNGQSQRSAVEIGLKNDDIAEIVIGLQEGDQIYIPIAKESTTATKQNQGGPPPI